MTSLTEATVSEGLLGWFTGSFGDPLNLALIPFVLALAWWRFGRTSRGVDGSSERIFGGLPSNWRTRSAWIPGALSTLAAVLLVVALARPLEGRVESRVTAEGIDILLVIDISSSMQRSGLEPGVTNLEVVKEVVARFISSREHDRLGIITFAVLPRSVSPLTLDTEALLARLDDVECVRSRSEEDGTAIGVALGHAARVLKDSPATSKVVVLLTDGEENQGKIHPMQAAELCETFGIKVHTVGAGRQFASAGPMRARADTTLIEKVAAETGGRFFLATDTNALEEVYAVIDEMERVEVEDWRYTEFEDVYHVLVLAAAGLLALELLLRRGPYLEFTG